jgi:N utilization substance protein B
MEESTMTRTTAREIAIHFAFELGFTTESADELLDQMLNPEVFASIAQVEPLYEEFPDEDQLAYIRKVVRGVGEHGYELDLDIEKYAKGWKFSRLPRTATAIMRVAMFEILYMPEIPNKVAVNEAVEVAKGYEDPEVVRYINGILGTFVRTEFGDQE